MTESDNFAAWESVQKQIEHAVKIGYLSKEKANETLKKARVSYGNRNLLRAIEMMKK